MRKELDAGKAAAKWIQQSTVPPKVGKGLGDDPHTHLQLFVALPIGFLCADCVWFKNGAQALLDHLGSNNEITAGFRVEWNVGRMPHGVETSRRTNQRAYAALVSLKKCFIAPVGTRPPSHPRA